MKFSSGADAEILYFLFFHQLNVSDRPPEWKKKFLPVARLIHLEPDAILENE
jgi:hypothetical protein